MIAYDGLMPSQSVAEAFLSFSVKRLKVSERDILRCCEPLSEEQMWARGGDHENSIANLMLHLEGNMRQWILHGIADQPDVRERDEEFTLVPSTNSADAAARFNATLDESAAVIAALPPDRLLTVIDPQPNGTWRHTTIL